MDVAARHRGQKSRPFQNHWVAVVDPEKQRKSLAIYLPIRLAPESSNRRWCLSDWSGIGRDAVLEFWNVHRVEPVVEDLCDSAPFLSQLARPERARAGTRAASIWLRHPQTG